MIDSGRLASRSVTFGGLAVSLAANLLHANLLSGNGSNEVRMIGSALPPLFLLGAVETVLNVRWRPGFWSWVVRVLLVPIAGISFYLSWLHMSELVASWGASDQEAFLYPIMIDVAMLLAAGAMILEDRTPEADRSGGSGQEGPAEADRSAAPGPVADPADRTPEAVLLPTGPPADRDRTPEADRSEEADRTPRGPRPDPPRTGDRTPSADPGPVGSRVEQLLPIARPMVEAEPSIGWKPLATKLRAAGHPIGTQTARQLRAALPGDESGEEVSSDGQGDDLHEGRSQEGLLRV